jgi:hypothetical protein
VQEFRGVEVNSHSGSNLLLRGDVPAEFLKRYTPDAAFYASTLGLNPSPNVPANVSLKELCTGPNILFGKHQGTGHFE